MKDGSGSGSAAVPEPDPEAEKPSSTPVEESSSAAAVASGSAGPPSRYEAQKRRDWNAFLHYLQNHKPPLTLAGCSGAHVIEFLKYLDQFGKTKVHFTGCPHFGQPNPPASCECPLKQAWGSLDALIGRLRAAYEENGGRADTNPFGARAVRIYLREVREGQAKARGVPYEKKRKRRMPTPSAASVSMGKAGGDVGGSGGDGDGDGPAATTSGVSA